MVSTPKNIFAEASLDKLKQFWPGHYELFPPLCSERRRGVAPKNTMVRPVLGEGIFNLASFAPKPWEPMVSFVRKSVQGHFHFELGQNFLNQRGYNCVSFTLPFLVQGKI